MGPYLKVGILCRGRIADDERDTGYPTIQSLVLTRLEAMREEVQTPECRHWLEQELEGYSLFTHAPWYRIIACRQRGHFLNLKTGVYLTCWAEDIGHGQTLPKLATRPGPSSVHLCP